jgi:hypothetical protein
MRAAIRQRLADAHARQSRPPITLDPSEALLTPAQVAEVLRVSPATVKRTFRGRPGTVFLAPSRSRMRIPAQVLKAYLEEGMVR